MRKYFKTETFPTLEEMVNVFAESKHAKRYCEFLNIYYNTLQNISKVYGFSLVRLDFQEMMCIVHRVDCTLIVELSKK